jgi:mRNA interferase MazF
MRPIHTLFDASSGKRRPCVVLTPERIAEVRTHVVVAPVTTRIRAIPSEVPLGPRNGLQHACVAKLDDMMTVPVSALSTTVIGWLRSDQEQALTSAVHAALGLT